MEEALIRVQGLFLTNSFLKFLVTLVGGWGWGEVGGDGFKPFWLCCTFNVTTQGINAPNRNSGQHPFHLQHHLKSHIRVMRIRKLSPTKEALDCPTNSPCHVQKTVWRITILMLRCKSESKLQYMTFSLTEKPCKGCSY